MMKWRGALHEAWKDEDCEGNLELKASGQSTIYCMWRLHSCRIINHSLTISCWDWSFFSCSMNTPSTWNRVCRESLQILQPARSLHSPGAEEKLSNSHAFGGMATAGIHSSHIKHQLWRTTTMQMVCQLFHGILISWDRTQKKGWVLL